MDESLTVNHLRRLVVRESYHSLTDGLPHFRHKDTGGGGAAFQTTRLNLLTPFLPLSSFKEEARGKPLFDFLDYQGVE